MGKRDKRVAFMNPIAAARARGPAPTSGPTIKDYLGRNRISLEEAQEKILKSAKQGGSDSLAAWEEELNDKYRKELKKAREKKLAAAAAPSFKKKKKKKVKKQARPRSRSHSPSLSDSDDDTAERKRRKRRKEKRKKRRKRHHSSSEESTPSDESEEESEAESSRRRKKKSSSLKDGRGSPPQLEPEDSVLQTTGDKELFPAAPEVEGRERTDKPTKWTDKWDVKER